MTMRRMALATDPPTTSRTLAATRATGEGGTMRERKRSQEGWSAATTATVSGGGLMFASPPC